jgi:hypothetical protein
MLRATNSFMYTGMGAFYPPIFLGLSAGYSFNTPKLPAAVPKQKAEKIVDKPLPGKYRKAIFVEGGGNVYGLSANFDMRLRPGRNDGPGFRAGVGYGAVLNEDDDAYFGLAIPLSYNYIFRNERSGIETGLGLTPTFATGNGISNPSLAVIANLGYRLQPLREGLIVRANWSPALDNRGFRSGVGFSLGYSFR